MIIFPAEQEIMLWQLEIDDNLSHQKRFPMDMFQIVVVEPVDCTTNYLFRDKPRKQGGGKGSVGNMKDEENKDKYTKEG